MALPAAGWFIRSGVWLAPLAAGGSGLTTSTAAVIRAADRACACSRDAAAAGSAAPRLPAPAPHSGCEQRRHNTTLSPPADQASTSAPSSGSLGLPGFLRNLFPGGSHLPARPAREAQAAPSSAAAGRASPSAPKDTSAGGAADSSDAEDIKQLSEMRNMDMEGYVEYCKRMRAGSEPPRPRQPPVPRNHYDYMGFMDMRRISFLRMQQHERIGSVITKEESDLILAQREEVLRDRALLERVAERTGVYIDLEVKDCIHQFLETRKNAERMHRYVVELGGPMPRSDEDHTRIVTHMRRLEANERLAEALSRRDRAACPLLHKLPWAGPAAVCEATGLRYWQCCGRAEGSALERVAGAKPDVRLAPGLMHHLRRDDHVVERERERKIHVAFKGRNQKKVRLAAKQAMKPIFRDH